MTLEEKMKTGALYDCSLDALSKDLERKLNDYKELLYDFNALRPSQMKEREEILRKVIGTPVRAVRDKRGACPSPTTRTAKSALPCRGKKIKRGRGSSTAKKQNSVARGLKFGCARRHTYGILWV